MSEDEPSSVDGRPQGSGSENTSSLPSVNSEAEKSLWGKAKNKLNAVSSKTASVGSAVASKAVEIGSTTASKAADVGKQTRAVANEATRGALEAGKQVYTGSRLESVISYLDEEFEQRGAKKALKSTTDVVIGKVDQVTGKRLLELLEEKLRVQDSYNDILATRLAEALQRISKLEAECLRLAKQVGASSQSPAIHCHDAQVDPENGHS